MPGQGGSGPDGGPRRRGGQRRDRQPRPSEGGHPREAAGRLRRLGGLDGEEAEPRERGGDQRGLPHRPLVPPERGGGLGHRRGAVGFEGESLVGSETAQGLDQTGLRGEGGGEPRPGRRGDGFRGRGNGQGDGSSVVQEGEPAHLGHRDRGHEAEGGDQRQSEQGAGPGQFGEQGGRVARAGGRHEQHVAGPRAQRGEGADEAERHRAAPRRAGPQRLRRQEADPHQRPEGRRPGAREPLGEGRPLGRGAVEARHHGFGDVAVEPGEAERQDQAPEDVEMAPGDEAVEAGLAPQGGSERRDQPRPGQYGADREGDRQQGVGAVAERRERQGEVGLEGEGREQAGERQRPAGPLPGEPLPGGALPARGGAAIEPRPPGSARRRPVAQVGEIGHERRRPQAQRADRERDQRGPVAGGGVEQRDEAGRQRGGLGEPADAAAPIDAGEQQEPGDRQAAGCEPRPPAEPGRAGRRLRRAEREPAEPADRQRDLRDPPGRACGRQHGAGGRRADPRHGDGGRHDRRPAQALLGPLLPRGGETRAGGRKGRTPRHDRRTGPLHSEWMTTSGAESGPRPAAGCVPAHLKEQPPWPIAMGPSGAPGLRRSRSMRRGRGLAFALPSRQSLRASRRCSLESS